MGSWANFSIGSFDFLCTKNTFFEKLNYFFNSSDLIEKRVCEDGEEYLCYYFETDVKTFKTCLDLMGYTLKKSKDEYENNLSDIYFDEIPNSLMECDERINKYLKRKFGYIRWKKLVQLYSSKMISGEISAYKHDYTQVQFDNRCEQRVFDSITDFNSDDYFGIPFDQYDVLNTIRVIVDNIDESEKITYDITDLVQSGYCNIEKLKDIDNWKLKKKIVLVEGTTDKSIIDFTLKNIYPHYSKFFYLMDFDSPKRPGSASEITRVIKAFANSGLEDEFIALYDNDVAGNKEILLSKEQKIEYPANIKIKTYPNIRFASKYPTMGTNGRLVYDNINGRACSIELYLPKEFLTFNGNLSHIIWKSLDDKLQKYQGEINNKADIFKRFTEYRSEIENGQKSFDISIWGNMKVLVDNIVFC